MKKKNKKQENHHTGPLFMGSGFKKGSKGLGFTGVFRLTRKQRFSPYCPPYLINSKIFK